MRPLKLSLQAFGSYPDLFEIDFVRLGQHGVFSITGPTGSGKTTIFDAMVYALYGKLPGKREADDVRSHFAKEGVETFVTFEFEVKGQSWTIERKPKQERKKARGEGTMVTPGTVSLRESDRTTGAVTSVRAVDKQVVELVGLDSNQFQQVVLLPQGEFEAVLKAETDQRVALLRQLFPVKIFNDFTAFLESEVKTRREELAEVESGSAFAQGRIRLAFSAALGAIPEGLDHPWYESLFDEGSFDFSLLAQRRNELNKIIDSVRPLSDASRKVLDGVNLERQRVSELIKAFDQWVANTQDALKFPAAEEVDVAREVELNQLQVLSGLATTLDQFEELVTLERSLEKSIEKDRTQLERRWIDGYDDEVLDDAKKIAALVRKVQSDIEKRGEGVGLQEELINLREELETLEESLNDEKDELAELESDEAEAVERVAELDSELKKARVTLSTEAKVKLAVAKAEQALKDAESHAEGEAKAAGIQKKLTSAKAALDKASSAFKAVQLKHREGIAGELATSLVDGEACPTCGSPEHPAPAKPKKSTPSAAEVEEAEAQRDAAQNSVSGLERDLAKIQGQISTVASEKPVTDLKRELKELQSQVGEITEAQEFVADAEDELKELKSAMKDRKPQLTKLTKSVTAQSAKFLSDSKRYTKDLAKFEKAFGELDDFEFDEDEYQEFATKLDSYGESLEGLQGTQRDVALTLATLQPHLAEHDVESPKELRKKLLSEDEIAKNRAAINERRSHRKATLDAIKAYEESDSPKERPDASEIDVRLEAARSTHDELFRSLTQLEGHAEAIQHDIASLSDNEAVIDAARKRVEEANGFYRLCSGQSAGQNEIRVALEEWVLSVYLKRVLRQANSRMHKMTSGRYSLQVNSLGGDNRKRHGLDLEVFDTFTGQSRKARTLSGGETFKSALALALGLADVVAAGSNRELDALFIDEGFGSLDEQSLEQVLVILDSLQNGGRVVGVISHVEELKRVLPRGIEVEGTDRGSKATVHYPEL